MESIQPVPIARICWLRSSPGTLVAAQERERRERERNGRGDVKEIQLCIAGNRFNRERAKGAGIGLEIQVGCERKRKGKRGVIEKIDGKPMN